MTFENFRCTSVALLILCGAIVGCGTPTAKIMNSWKGNHVSRLIRSWGPPDYVTIDGKGGKVYIWERDINLPLTDARSKTKGTITYSPYQDEYTIKSKTVYTDAIVLKGKKVRMFWVDQNGIIYSWKAKGFVNDHSDTVVLILISVGLLGAYILSDQIARGGI